MLAVMEGPADDRGRPEGAQDQDPLARMFTPWVDDSWQAAAACRGVDTDVFFTRARVAEAKQICGRCSVVDECLEAALRRGDVGVWGGVWLAGGWLGPDPGDRPVRRGRPRRRLAVKVVDECGEAGCGTRGRYLSGCRGEACRWANTEYSRELRLRFRCGVDERCGTAAGYSAGGRCGACRDAVVGQCGTTTGYHTGCRCPDCVDARSEYRRRKAIRDKASFRCGVDDRCGTTAGYAAGGRCKHCLMSMRADWRRNKRRQSGGTQPEIEGCGAVAGYRNGCRCGACQDAYRRRLELRRRATAARAAAFRCGIDDRCGTPSGYTLGGRCDRCRESMREKWQRKTRRRRSTVSTESSTQGESDG